MQGAQGATGAKVFGDAASRSQGASSSEDKNERSSIFSPPRPKMMKGICTSEETIEVSESDDERKPKVDSKKNNK